MVQVLSLHPDQALPTNFFDKLSNNSYDAAMLLFKPDQSIVPHKPELSSGSGPSNRMHHRGFTSPLSPSSSFVRLNTSDSSGDLSTGTSAAGMAGFKSFSPVSPGRKGGNPTEQTALSEGDPDVSTLNLSKYFKMLEIGINRAEVKEKMEKDGVDTRYIDLPSFLRGGFSGGNGVPKVAEGLL